MNLLEETADFKGLKKLDGAQIPELCYEIRKKIIDVTLKNGGHLSSSLGAVELTVALLRAFNPENDKIIFDVGHQSYAYKILTDRLKRFNTLRKKDGIAGFPRMDESPYDYFTTGHSSTSISAAAGYAKARDLLGKDYNVIAVIGDGALLNGVSFEGLNSISALKSKIIIILNDNKMSINPRIGGMAQHLAKLAVSPAYTKLKEYIKNQCAGLKNGTNIQSVLSHIKTKLKSLLLPTNVFEEIGISYWGPFNGHDTNEMEEVFKLAKAYDKPLLIHVITVKGKGCQETEADPSYFHGVSPCSSLDKNTIMQNTQMHSWSEIMADTLYELAEVDPKLTVCTAAMKDGTKLEKFANKYPARFFDVGISEEHMLVYAAGLAAAGMHPAVCIYSTFLQRAVDQVMHDITLSKLPVLLGVDRAGLVGEDGETHHGILDLSWLRSIPNITIAAPRDAFDLRFFVQEWQKRQIPMAVRYPRGKTGDLLFRESTSLPQNWGKAELLRKGNDVCIFATGSTVELAVDSAEQLQKENVAAAVVDIRFIKPLDYNMIDEIAKTTSRIITVEENILSGGVGEAITSYICRKGYNIKVFSIGINDKYISHATRKEQWEDCGLSVSNIVKTYREMQ